MDIGPVNNSVLRPWTWFVSFGTSGHPVGWWYKKGPPTTHKFWMFIMYEKNAWQCSHSGPDFLLNCQIKRYGQRNFYYDFSQFHRDARDETSNDVGLKYRLHQKPPEHSHSCYSYFRIKTPSNLGCQQVGPTLSNPLTSMIKHSIETERYTQYLSETDWPNKLGDNVKKSYLERNLCMTELKMTTMIEGKKTVYINQPNEIFSWLISAFQKIDWNTGPLRATCNPAVVHQ